MRQVTDEEFEKAYNNQDNRNIIEAVTKKYANKLLKDCVTHYQFTKKVYKLFKKIYKQKAKLKYIQCYNLLRLRTE